MKTDYKLGLKISRLLTPDLENPVCQDMVSKWTERSHIEQLEKSMTTFITGLGLDIAHKSLEQTPRRIVKLFLENLFWGLDYHNFPAITLEENHYTSNSPLFSKNIKLNSTCEHHFVPIKGSAMIAYIPDKKIIGFGNLNKIVNFFAHRPQLQERLTRQVLIVLQYLLATQDVAIAINAKHDCIDKGNSNTNNNKILSIESSGAFLTDEVLKSSFYQLAIKLK